MEELGFESSWRYALGLDFKLAEHWTLRGGIAFDESPIPNLKLRSTRLPDMDRRWLSFGTSYQLNSRYSIDLAYTHLFIKDAPLNRLGATEDLLVGDYESSANVVSLQLNKKF